MKKVEIYQVVNNFERYRNVDSICLLNNNVENPLFSIIIPTYKRIDTLIFSLKSAIHQEEFDNYEIVIVNNSTEGTNDEVYDIVTSLNSDRLSYYVNSKNIGLCGNWNRAIELSRGKYIVMLHDDDLLSPYCLRSLYDVVLKYKEPGIIGVDYYKFNSKDIPKFEKPINLKCFNITKIGYFLGRNINIAGMTFKKDLAIEIGGFNDNYYPNEDTIFIYQALLRSKVVNIKQKLAGYRVELNATLTGDTLQQIILLTEETRRSIATRNIFADYWMKCFELEYFYEYVTEANKHWNTNLSFDKLCELVKLDDKKISKFKYKLMFIIKKILLKILC